MDVQKRAGNSRNAAAPEFTHEPGGSWIPVPARGLRVGQARRFIGLHHPRRDPAHKAVATRFMRRIILLSVLLLIAWRFSALASPPADRSDSRIADSQLTLRTGRTQGQATVIAAADDRLTVLTVAHFLSENDVARAVTIRRRDLTVNARIAEVARNPHFGLGRPGPQRELAANTIGVDTAVAVLRVEPHNDRERRLLTEIRPVDLTVSPFPAGPNQIVSVHIVDQFGDVHAVRAGNHLNPKCLAWGAKTYTPKRGDSGAGVFVLRKSDDGELRPLLIGSVCQADARGGIASLAFRSAPWIERTLHSARTEQPAQGQDVPGQ